MADISRRSVSQVLNLGDHGLDGSTIVNPGSVGLPAYSTDFPKPHVMESGSPHARYALLTRSANMWQVELIAVLYDHMHAAAQARKNQRPDWEVALRLGLCSSAARL